LPIPIAITPPMKTKSRRREGGRVNASNIPVISAEPSHKELMGFFLIKRIIPSVNRQLMMLVIRIARALNLKKYMEVPIAGRRLITTVYIIRGIDSLSFKCGDDWIVNIFSSFLFIFVSLKD